MATSTKVQFQFSTAYQPLPEIWLDQVLAVAETLSSELGVSADVPAVISLVGFDHLKLLMLQTTGTAVITLTYSDASTMVFEGTTLVLGFDSLATKVVTGIQVALPTPPAPEEGEDPIVYPPIKVCARAIGV